MLFLGTTYRHPDWYIVTEYCDRGSLADVLHDKRIAVPWETQLRMGESSFQAAPNHFSSSTDVALIGYLLPVILQYTGFTAKSYAVPATDIAAGMNYLHLSSIVHRDLKSANLLVSGRDMRVKIAGVLAQLRCMRFACASGFSFCVAI